MGPTQEQMATEFNAEKNHLEATLDIEFPPLSLLFGSVTARAFAYKIDTEYLIVIQGPYYTAGQLPETVAHELGHIVHMMLGLDLDEDGREGFAEDFRATFGSAVAQTGFFEDRKRDVSPERKVELLSLMNPLRKSGGGGHTILRT